MIHASPTGFAGRCSIDSCFVLAGEGKIHFTAKPHLTHGTVHVLNAVNDLPFFGSRSEQEERVFSTETIFFLVFHPRNRAQACKTNLGMFVFHHVRLVARFNEIALLAVLAAVEVINFCIGMKEMIEEHWSGGTNPAKRRFSKSGLLNLHPGREWS